MPTNRRAFITGAGAVAGALALPVPAFAAGNAGNSGNAPAPGTPQAEALGSVATGDTYADRVNYALQQNPDHWGQLLLAGPDGPTLANIRPLLTPANIASTYVTQSGWYYLPLTDKVPDAASWLAERDFTIHVADGSQITSQFCWAQNTAQRQFVNFRVGAGYEVYGSAVKRLAAPALWGGWLPVLDNSYTDSHGTRWDRESFAARIPQIDQLVSLVKVVAHRGSGPAATTLRLELHTPGEVTSVALAAGARALTTSAGSLLLSSVAGRWHAPYFDIPVNLKSGTAEIYLLLPNAPATIAAGTAPSADLHQRTRQSTADYWTGAVGGQASIGVPEPYAVDALRNVLLQNLVMSWQQSIGNGYETADPTFAFVPEVSTSVAALGDFGFLGQYRDALAQLLVKGQGPDTFPNWEKGIRMQSAARYVRLSNDHDYLLDNLATFQGYLADFTAQRAADPHGLLAKQRYGSDIPQAVYGVHHQSEGWRGMRDVGLVLRQLGQNAAAKPFLDEAAALHTSLMAAIKQSSTRLPDGSLYVPISLLDPTAPPPYPQITATRDGSYWNLTMPYALATGIFGPADTKALLRYISGYGGLFVGLLRFNESGINPPGVFESGPTPPFPAEPGGYETPGVDEQYLYSLIQPLAEAGDPEELVLAFYGKLGQDLTPGTFIGGEGTTLSPAADRPAHLRSQWFPPLSANNAVYLHLLRELLVHEDLDASGNPTVLHLAPATPRAWLAPGQRIEIRDLPTLFGPVGFTLTAARSGVVSATVTPPPNRPGGLRPTSIVLHVRAPGGAVQLPLGAPTAAVTVSATPSGGHPGGDQARPTVVTPERLLFQPGSPIPLTVTVEALGGDTVSGKLQVRGPKGWPGATGTFSVPSKGRIGWQVVSVPLTVPPGTAPGTYQLTLTANPSSGAASSRVLNVEVAVPSALSYPELVAASKPSGYWRLGEKSGGTAADSSGRGGAGAFRGGVELGQPGAIAGDPDGAVRLDAGYVEVPDSPAVSFSGAYTLEAWIKVTSADQQGIIEKYTPPANDGYVLRTVEANKLFAQNLGGGVLSVAVTGPTTVLPPLWHHVAATYDGSALTVYLDGEVESRATGATPPADGTATLKLGGRGDDGSSGLKGWLDEVAVYPSALSQDTLRGHFRRGVLGAPKPDQG